MKFKKIVVIIMLACAFVNGPKSLGWWSFIYTNEQLEENNEEKREIRFFFIDWISDLACKFK